MKEIKLTYGYSAIIDDEDYEKIIQHEWRVCKIKINGNEYSPYAAMTINKKIILMHRYILDASKDDVIDHLNHNGLDNRRCNLKIGTMSDNQRNRKLNRNNTSGFSGVHKYKNRWIVDLRLFGKRVVKKSFKSLDDAICFRKELNKTYSFNENHGT